MKNIILFTLIFHGTNFIVKGQFSQGAKDSVQTEIRHLTNEWNKAIMNRDSLTLEKLLAPEYSLNGSVTRSIWINNTLHHFTTDTLEISTQLNTTLYGQIVKSEGAYYWKASYDGNPRING